VVPSSLRQMMLKYFQDAVLSGHLGARKTLQTTPTNVWWPKMRGDVFDYVRKCELCLGAKLAQNTQVAMNAASSSS
jgi:hypothetical protein